MGGFDLEEKINKPKIIMKVHFPLHKILFFSTPFSYINIYIHKIGVEWSGYPGVGLKIKWQDLNVRIRPNICRLMQNWILNLMFKFHSWSNTVEYNQKLGLQANSKCWTIFRLTFKECISTTTYKTLNKSKNRCSVCLLVLNEVAKI